AESTNANFSHLRERASLVARAMAAEKLLKDATIAGEDYVDITSNYDISFEGIEDEVLYEANKSKLWEIDEFKDLAAEYVNKMTLASNALKGQVYSDELRAIDSKKRAYEDEKIDLVTYYEYLYEKAQENEIPMYTFPNFANLVKARQIEKKMNLPEEDTENAGSQAELYMEYRKLTQDLNINDLFKEEPILEDLVKEYTATNSDQKKLIRISKALSILSNLLRIKVVPEEYQYFQEHKSDFDPQFWMDFLNKKSQELSLSLALPNNFYIITDNLNTIEQFYHIADERNKAFLENTNKHIKKHNTEIAVLKAGGFHTPRLTALLAENGYSYIVISPKVTTKTDEALYRSTLKRK
ncbi:MAG: hypothetical protein QGI05_04785, partial [Candidatus Omnitrophota bacterium]|nr:hypothetical protein [Candidatus Omnitrophota bacterium]